MCIVAVVAAAAASSFHFFVLTTDDSTVMLSYSAYTILDTWSAYQYIYIILYIIFNGGIYIMCSVHKAYHNLNALSEREWERTA